MISEMYKDMFQAARHAALHPDRYLASDGRMLFPPIAYDRFTQTEKIGSGTPTYIGNTGDMNMAMPIHTKDLYHGWPIVQYDDVAYGSLFLANTGPNDKLVLADSAGFNKELVPKIRASLATIGVAVAQNVEYTNSIAQWLIENNPTAISPYMPSPRVLEPFSEHPAKLVDINIALYTKSGFALFCNEHGIPIPDTVIGRYMGRTRGIFEAANRISTTAKEFVLSTEGDTSGEGVFFAKGKELSEKLAQNFHYGENYTLQEKLDVETSPCMRVYIGDEPDKNVIIGVTRQRLVNGGYAGNVWHEEIEEKLSAYDPDFMKVHEKLITELQRAGVRGVVNIDSMIIRDAKNGGYKTVLRELNARKAFSHPLGRMIEQGNIDGQSIRRIQTKYKVDIPMDFIRNEDFIQQLNQFCDPTSRVVFLTRSPDEYNEETGKTQSYGYLVFASSNADSEDNLDDIQAKTLAFIANYQRA